MWCEQTLWPVKTDRVETLERSASTVVTAQSHGLTTLTAAWSVSTTPRVQCRALNHREESDMSVKAMAQDQGTRPGSSGRGTGSGGGRSC